MAPKRTLKAAFRPKDRRLRNLSVRYLCISGSFQDLDIDMCSQCSMSAVQAAFNQSDFSSNRPAETTG